MFCCVFAVCVFAHTTLQHRQTWTTQVWDKRFLVLLMFWSNQLLFSSISSLSQTQGGNAFTQYQYDYNHGRSLYIFFIIYIIKIFLDWDLKCTCTAGMWICARSKHTYIRTHKVVNVETIICTNNVSNVFFIDRSKIVGT